jgi:hypothetical protein
MALSDIRTDVQANWPDDYHSTKLTSAKVDEFINKVQRKVCRVHNFTFMEQEVTRSTVDEQRRYSLPTAGDSNWTEVASGTVFAYKDEISCELINSVNYRRELIKLLKKSIEENYQFRDVAALGTPTHYCIRALYLELWKLPDHDMNDDTAWTINFEFYGYLADLSADTDTNEIVSQHPLVLEYGATALGFQFGADFELAAYYENKANEVLAEMIRADNSKKLSSLEEGMRPARGQSLGGESNEVLNLKAFYE